MAEQDFNYKDSLKLIDRMIAQVKYRPGPTDGIITLMWGYLVFTAALLHWVLEVIARVEYAPASWCLMIVGAIATMVISRRARRKQRAKTYIDMMITQVWLAFSISFALLFVAMQPYEEHFLPSVMLLYGLSTWMHGSLIRYRPYRLGAIASWLGSALAFWLSPEEQLLVLAAAVVLGYIIPGHLLYAKTRTTDV